MTQRMVNRQLRPIWIFVKKPFVFVCKAIASCVIRRIYIYYVNFSAMGIVETCQSVIVITFYQNMSWFSVIITDCQFWNFLNNWYFVFAFLVECFRNITTI